LRAHLTPRGGARATALGAALAADSGERVELSPLLALVDAARVLGATVAAWGDERVLDARSLLVGPSLSATAGCGRAGWAAPQP